ncbi:hypothetical protein RJ640_006002 [Escallonia rubra]|uniref:Uncharacterized protein n=1 Tax=Escallonia rubra TaxID=112253 RepID=A0AA88UEP1_9ASTE|nr:hypothetical protein RJ640_006002 [Escallonia rubra]
MEDYNHHQLSENSTRGSFLYGGGGGGPVVLAPPQHHMLQSSQCSYQSNDQGQVSQHPAIKIEVGSNHHQQQQQQQHAAHKFYDYPSSLMRGAHQAVVNHHHHQQGQDGNYERCSHEVGGGDQGEEASTIKAKIIAHPHYNNLLQAYLDCQQVGAPPEVMARLTAVRQEFETRQQQRASNPLSRYGRESTSSKDPELDQFMEAYYDMLVKYREELTRPLQEAMEFMRRIETQLNMLSTTTTTTNGTAPTPLRIFSTSDEKCEGIGSSEEDQDNSGGETELPEIDPRAEDRELKNHLLRKYSGYLSSLKQELSKKKKKGKLPKDARQKLLNWWELHYKWPYPSETEKVALAESTGLDQKQINNWFINQRKRHWKPSEDMQFMVMDGLHPQSAALYMEGHYMGEGPYRLGP